MSIFIFDLVQFFFALIGVYDIYFVSPYDRFSKWDGV